MKTLFAFGLCIAAAASLAGQSRTLSRPLGLNSGAGALGGTYVSPVMSRPLGGVALPSFGSAPAKRKSPSRTILGGYAGPVYYIPNAYDGSWADTSSWASLPPQPSGQPVIINQYFVTKGSSVPDVMRDDVMPNEAPAPAAEPVNPGDPLAPPATYYLIAYKDRSIYSALAYWIEGDTLHYVTTQNTHNQASLNLIDVDQTYKLNTDRSVPFSIPGR